MYHAGKLQSCKQKCRRNCPHSTVCMLSSVFNMNRYANHAKQIKNKPKRNADVSDGILAALEEEIRL